MPYGPQPAAAFCSPSWETGGEPSGALPQLKRNWAVAASKLA